MNPAQNWHPTREALQGYADGASHPAQAASVEAHLLTCATCRSAVAPAVSSPRLALIKTRLEDELDAAARPLFERLVGRLGVSEVDRRVLFAAPSLRRAWWLAVLLAVALALLAAGQPDARADQLLVLAPLLPVITTAVSYAPRHDLMLALTAATPYPAMRLLLLRTVAVALAATLLGAAASAALPVGVTATAIWLLPAAALTAAALALATWVDVSAAAGLCCASWLAAVWVVRSPDPLVVYDLAGQLISAGVLAVAATVLARHRHRLDPGSHA